MQDLNLTLYAYKFFLHHTASKTKVSFTGSTLDVDEGAGLLNDSLFIEIEGVAEPTLFVQLSMQGPLGGIVISVNLKHAVFSN